MKTHKLKLTILCLLMLPCVASWGQADKNETDWRVGVTYVAARSAKGTVDFLDPDDKPIANVKVDDVLPIGSTIRTKAGGKVVLLFSNGTVTTLQANGQLKVKSFAQGVFKAGAEKMSDLKTEPSPSELNLNLDFGDLVVGTKNLIPKKSKMSIITPIGTAGIRGTQFQVAQQKGGAMALDVTESTVRFTPKGARAEDFTPVGPSRGLDVGVGGALAPRPVSPVAAQNVNAANTGAFALTAEVSLGEVSTKVEESAPTEPESVAPKEKERDDTQEKDPQNEKPDGEKEPGGGSEPGGEREPGGGSEPGGEREPGSGAPRAEGGPNDNRREGGPAKGPGGRSPSERLASTTMSPQVNTDQVMENNPTVKSVRKLGKLDERTDRMLKQEFSHDLMERFFSYPEDLQDHLLTENPTVAQRLMRINPPTRNLAIFYGYDLSTRKRLLQIENNQALANFLDRDYDGAFASALLTPSNLDLVNNPTQANPSALDEPSDAKLFGTASSLLSSIHASGNDFILAELLESGGGELTITAIVDGLQGNRLLMDVDMSGGFDASREFASDSLENPFYVDVASVWTLTKADLNLDTTRYATFAGDNVALSSGSYDYGSYLDDGLDTILVTASSGLSLTGEIVFDDSTASEGKTRVVLMSGGGIESDSGTTLSHALSDLVLTARDDVNLSGATLSAGRRLEILGQRDLSITDGQLEAGESIRLQAAKNLNLNSVQFSQGLPSLYLQATTVNLRNLNFPNGSSVNINSLKGGFDGKYPNFGSQAFGRVNFIEKVKYGDNLMNDRPSFDLHGKNVTIGKMPQP